MRSRAWPVWSWLPVMALAGCTAVPDEPPEPPLLATVEVRFARYALPVVTDAQLSRVLEELTDVSGFVLYQGGIIHHERYRNGAAADRNANIKSASKNVIGALLGIALELGHVADLDDPISRYLPHYFEGLEPAKQEITIRHLLTMSSGLASTSSGNYGAWVVSRDWVRYALAQPLIDPPGTRMVYSTGDTHLLAAVLTAATGVPLRAFAERHLFEPLGIRLGGWDRDPQGVYFGGNNMALSPRALLAFGRLYLDAGARNGAQVLAPEWIQESWQVRFPRANFRRNYDYGYLWWHRRIGGFEAWFAWGHGGQHLFVLPELDAVVVFTADPDRRAPGLNDAILHTMTEAVVPWLYHTERLRNPRLARERAETGADLARIAAGNGAPSSR